MRLLDEKTQVKNAIIEFTRELGDGSYLGDKRGRMVGAELKALDPELVNAAQIAEIIGNATHVAPQTCSECGTVTWHIVEVGEPSNFDSATALLCETCLEAALVLVRSR